MTKPNILIFCADEMRADHMGCGGNSIVKTPNLDRIAAEGTVFDRSYVSNPICMPARASMFTGLMPRDHGVCINGQTLRKDLPTLAGVLAEAGYRTHSAGKLHLTPWVPKHEPADTRRFPECLDYWEQGKITEFPTPYYGFQSVDFVGGHTSYAYGQYIDWLKAKGGNPKDLTQEKAMESARHGRITYAMSLDQDLHYNRYIADSTIRVINQSNDDDTPFFIWCSFPDPHAPVALPAPWCHMYDPDDIPPPAQNEEELKQLPDFYRDVMNGVLKPNGVDNTNITDRAWQEFIAGTYGMISHMDAEIGRVLNTLQRSGEWDNTIILFLSDHGDMMGDHRLFGKAFYTYQGCIRIPAIARIPGGVQGQHSDALISQIDLMPSVLDACDIDLPPGSEAAETPFQRGAVTPLRSYPGHSWRAIVETGNPGTREHVVIENDDPGTGLRPRTLVTARYRLTIYPGHPEGELFDLENDPDELVNLWNTHPDLRKDLQVKLLDGYTLSTPMYPIPPWNS